MKSPLLFGVLTALSFISNLSASAQGANDIVPDHYLVQLRAGANPNAAAARHGIKPTFLYSSAVRGYAAMIPPGQLRKIAADPEVVSMAPDRVVTIVGNGKGKPGGGGGGGGGGTPPEVEPEGVKRVGAIGSGYGGQGVGIAIVDTGIDLGNADLLVGSAGFSAFGGSAMDDNGHGTHVSGIAAAQRNSIGVVGVASNATVFAVKVLDASGSGSDAMVMSGLTWVYDHRDSVTPPIRVVNMSLGRPGTVDDSPMLHDAITALVNANVSVVVAAGNDASLEIGNQIPSGYPEVMAVASTTARDGAANRRGQSIPGDSASFFASDGAGVAISAPGEEAEDVNNGGFISSVGILSTALGGGTTRLSGTSMASPHTAGVVALLYQKSPLATPAQIRAALHNGADGLNVLPLGSPTGSYSFDGVREGVLWAPGALAQLP